jgi:hypothetical protein
LVSRKLSTDRLSWIYLIALVAAAIMPIVILAGIPHAARTYAQPDTQYATRYGDSSIVWKSSQGLFEVRYDTIARIFMHDDVVILALKGSRAICVLPAELIPSEKVNLIRAAM